jgi:hypothetical protein
VSQHSRSHPRSPGRDETAKKDAQSAGKSRSGNSGNLESPTDQQRLLLHAAILSREYTAQVLGILAAAQIHWERT